MLNKRTATRSSKIGIAHWMQRSSQIDAQFPKVIQAFPARISRLRDLGDSIMTAIALAPFADASKTFEDLGRLRLQECERVQALHAELKKCGASIVEMGSPLGDTQTVGGNAAGGHVGGFSILQAATLDAAATLLDGHPHLMMPGATIELLEFLPIPGM